MDIWITGTEAIIIHAATLLCNNNPFNGPYPEQPR